MRLMRKAITVLLICLIVFFICGCTRKKPANQKDTEQISSTASTDGNSVDDATLSNDKTPHNKSTMPDGTVVAIEDNTLSQAGKNNTESSKKSSSQKDNTKSSNNSEVSSDISKPDNQSEESSSDKNSGYYNDIL